MTLGDDVTALCRDAQRAVGRLLRIRVHRLVREEKRKRFLALALQKIDSQAIHDVGDVAAVLHVFAVVIQPRVVQLSVSVIADPGVVTGSRHAVVAHVPLADVRSFVPEPLQLQVIVGQAMAHRIARDVIDDPVPAGVLPADDRGTIRRTDRRRMKSALEDRPFARKPIDVRRLHVRMTAGAKLVVAQIVDQDHEKIGLHASGATWWTCGASYVSAAV